MNRTRNEGRRGAVRGFLGMTTVMAACAWTAPVTGQLLPPATSPRPTSWIDDPLILNTNLFEHTPRAVTGVRPEDGMTGHLMAVTTQGVAYRKYRPRSRNWSSWTYRASPAGVPPTDTWDISMPLVRSLSGGANVIDGFFGYLSGLDGMVGLPGATDAPISMDFGTLPSGSYFHADCAIAYTEGSVQKFRVFGSHAVDGDPDGSGNLYSPMVRIDWDGMNATFADDLVPTGCQAVLLGPQSACAVTLGGSQYPRHMVFATARYSTGDKVAIHCWNGASWSWKDLGAPYANTKIVSHPLVVYRYDTPGAPPQVNVFIVAKNAGASNSPYILFEKYCNGSITGSPSMRTDSLVWGGWNDYGVPTDGNGTPVLQPGTKFYMTSGNVWKNGSILRVDLFGHSNVHTNASGVQTQGQLYRFYWDQYGWSWDHPAGAPDGQSFRTTSSFVVEDGSYDRVTVVGRTRTGRIYERYYEVVNGVQFGWNWNDLSIKPVFSSTLGL